MPRREYIIAFFVIVSVALVLFVVSAKSSDKRKEVKHKNSGLKTLTQLQVDNTFSHTMNITSTAFSNNEYIPPRYTCDGENVLPPIEINGVPEEAASVAVVVDDPDAPGGVWNHWSIWNIPAQPSVRLDGDSIPSGAKEGVTDFGTKGYGGPCPPKGTGTHRYIFKVYALPAGFTLDDRASIGDIRAELEENAIDYVELTGLYTRDKQQKQ